MALYKGPQPKSGININGKDALEYRPEDVRELINNDETGILRAMFQAQLMDSNDENAIAIPDNYAEHAGRPSISELPFMNSENDGMPYLKGHSPICNGKDYHNGMCKCKYDTWNEKGGIGNKQMWPGGPTVDDFYD